jgi:hypothetical protein
MKGRSDHANPLTVKVIQIVEMLVVTSRPGPPCNPVHQICREHQNRQAFVPQHVYLCKPLAISVCEPEDLTIPWSNKWRQCPVFPICRPQHLLPARSQEPFTITVAKLPSSGLLIPRLALRRVVENA